MTVPDFRCGYVALVGRPNVGKSTLLNRVLGQKLSITANKPQTTRHQILGIHTTPAFQIVFVDTPGMHQAKGRAINRFMNRAALNAIEDVDVVCFLIEAMKWTPEDEAIRRQLRGLRKDIVLVVNKIDRVKDKSTMLPFLNQFSQWEEFAQVVPLSAIREDNIEEFERTVAASLPVAEAQFPEDQLTDRSERFLAAELIREKLTRKLDQELPYQLTVEIESFESRKRLHRISAVIWAERESQKKIIIGRGGRVLKSVGQEARENMEAMFGGKVYLKLWVKVRQGWSDDVGALRTLGYESE
jgi:GTP-binding protein Era